LVVATALRAETAYALDAGTSSTLVQYLTGSYAIVPEASVFVRGGFVGFLPEATSATSAFTNATVGGLWAPKTRGPLRVAVALGMGLPVGQGGGDSPNAGEAAAIAAGNLARSRFEGSTTFLPNDVAPFLGGDLAWVTGEFTVQAEATLFEAVRVRADRTDPDANRTSMTAGLHAGYFILPELSISAELRDQTFLSTPVAVEQGKTARSWVTVGGGPRVHVRLADGIWLHPGLAFIQPLNDASPGHSASSYHIIQLDVPLSF
jgi:hypothetical protein